MRKLFVFLLLLQSMDTWAQAEIFYTNFAGNPLPLEAVSTCQDSSFINQARIEITSNDVDSLIISINTPPGVNFIVGSERIVSSSRMDGLTLQYIGPDPVFEGQHNFQVLPYDLNAGDYFTIEWTRQADCGAVAYQQTGGIFKDYVILTWNSGQFLDLNDDVRSYDVLVPALSISGEGPIITSLGDTVDRAVTITNGGLGELDEFTFYIIDGFGTITTQLETAGGTVIDTSSVNGDTLFYTLSSAEIAEFGDNDVHYEDGEQMMLKRTYMVTECDNNSGYRAYWGCDTLCQATTILEQSTIIENVVPNLSVTMPNTNPDYCYDGSNSVDGGAPLYQTVQVKNNGNGPATNFELTLRTYQAGSNTGANYFNTDLWVIKDAGGAVLGNMTNHTSLTFRSHPGSNCTDATQPTQVKQEATGIVILPGESIFIEVPTFVPNYECTNNCDTYFSSWWSYSGEWAYQDQCEMNNYGVSDQRFDNRAHNFMNYTVEMPTDLVDQQEFTADISYSNIHTKVKSTTEGYVNLIVDLSNSNLVYNGGPTIPTPWTPVVNMPVTVIGDSIIISMPVNIAGKTGLVPISLKADCAGASGGAQTVGFSHHTKYDQNCPGDGLYKYCLESGFQMHCPAPCPRGGATPLLFTLERQTKGNPDYNENHLPDNTSTAHPDSINLHRAVNGDTILGTWNIVVYPNVFDAIENPIDTNIGKPFNHTYVEFDLREHPYDNCTNPLDGDMTTVFTPLPNAEVQVYPAGGGPMITCTVTPIITGFIAKYDLGACQNVWNGGDSIVVKAKYIANASVSSQGFVLYIADNEVYSSYIPNPTGSNPSDENKYTCDHFNDYMNVLNIFHSPYMPNPQDINGCNNSFTVNTRQYVNVQASAVWFPNEYRNFSLQDEYTVEWPPELVYRPGTAKFNNLIIPDANVSQVGNQLIFTNLKDYYTPYGGSIVPPDEVESKSITWSVDPSCDAEAGKIYKGKFFSTQIGNGVNTPSADWDSYTTCSGDYKYSGTSSMKYDGPLPFITGGGSEQASENTAQWEVILNNGSNSLDADLTWFYINDVNGTLMNFTIMQGATVLIPNGDGFFEIGNNPANSSTPYTVIGELADCADGKIELITGYHCSAYPSDINGLSCADTVILESTNLPSEVQLAFITQPTVSMDLCVDQPIKLKQTSAQAAYLDDPKMSFVVPNGVIMPATVNVEYPEGSGFIETLTPTIVGSEWTINFEDHSQITAVGIPGTIDALSPQDRSVILDFMFGTDCDFLSGGNFVFQAFGNRPCGLPAINNGVRVRTVDLDVTGVNKPFVNNFTLSSPNFEGCAPTTLSADIEFVGLNALTTSDQDSVYIILEESIEYIPGSFNCTNADPADCLVFNHTTTDAAGNTVIVLSMPAGGLDIDNPLTSSFTYQAKMGNADMCDDLKRIDYRVVTQLGNVACATEATGVCPGLAVTTGQDNVEVKVKKTVVSFIGTGDYCHESSGVTYTGSVRIDSLAVGIGDSLILDVYCADASGNATTYQESITLLGPIALGEVVDFNGSLSGSCTPENGVVIKLDKISNDNSEQCICNDKELFIEGVEELTCTASKNQDVNCNGEKNGSATVSPSGGNLSYTYLWDNGDTRATADTLGFGLHSVTVTDIKGCTRTCMVQIDEPAELTCMASKNQDVDCYGEKNGSATVSPSGGNLSYTYLWDNGDTRATADTLGVGLHSVTVTDSKGCTTSCTVQIDEPAELTCTTSKNQDVNCNGEKNGSATVNSSGGNVSHTYLWDNGDTRATADTLGVGLHSVTVTDSKGCTTSCTVQIDEPAELTCTTSKNQDVNCNGEKNGSATVNSSGGNVSHTYLWDNGDTRATADTLGVGLHSVTVTDSKGCTTSCTVQIDEPAELTCTTSKNQDVNCNGEKNGSATVNSSGGNVSHTYLWDNGDTRATADTLGVGLHSVTVTDSKGCTKTCTVQIDEPAELTCTTSKNQDVNCNGEKNGSATVNSSGGNVSHTYLWDNGDTRATADTLGVGLHSVTVTDSKGCTKTCTVQIEEPSELTCTTTKNQDVECNSKKNGSATVNSSGGNVIHTYLWDNGDTRATADTLGVGLHSVTVTDSKGCTKTCTVQIEEPSELTCTTTKNQDVNCNGEKNGSATVNSSGGNVIHTYLWDNGDTRATADTLGVGLHSVTVTDSKGCTKTCTVLIEEPSELTCTTTKNQDVNCNGEKNGSATVNSSGGNVIHTYLWDNGDTRATADTLGVGLHSVTVTDSKGCTTSCTVQIDEPAELTCTTSKNQDVNCNGEKNGSATVNSSGGNVIHTYLWDNGDTRATADTLGFGLHSVTVTDIKGCTRICMVQIDEPSELTCTASKNQDVDCYGEKNGSATVSPSGGNLSYTYLWDNGDTRATADTLGFGLHSVTVTDIKGCTRTCMVQIEEPAELTCSPSGG